jgi:hypothetical protein
MNGAAPAAGGTVTGASGTKNVGRRSKPDISPGRKMTKKNREKKKRGSSVIFNPPIP